MKRFALLALVVALGCDRAPKPAAPSPVAGKSGPPPGKGAIRPGTFIPWIESGRTVEAWIKDLCEGDDNARWQARYNLQRMKEQAVPKLMELLASPDAKLRQRAAWCFGSMGKEAAKALDLLIAALHDPDADVARTAAGAFAGMGELAAPAAPALVRALMSGPSDGDHVLAQVLVRDLRVAGETALIEGLHEPDTDKAHKAFASLDSEMTGTHDFAVWLLDRALRTHADAAVRRQAVAVLRRLHGDRSLAYASLIRALLEDADAGVRASSAKLLGRISGNDPDLRVAATPALREAMKDPDASVSDAAQLALRQAEPGGADIEEKLAEEIERKAELLEGRGAFKEAAAALEALITEYGDSYRAERWREALKRVRKASGESKPK